MLSAAPAPDMKYVWGIIIALIGVWLLIPWWPAGVMLALYHALNMLSGALWPDALAPQEHWFLTSLWLAGVPVLLSSLLAFRAKKDKRYLLICGTVFVSLLTISLFNMPLTAEGGRRWKVANELQNTAWRSYYSTGESLVNSIEESAFREREKAQNNLGRLIAESGKRQPLSYLPEDAATAEAIWRRAIDGEGIAQLEERASWLVDQPDLMMAAAILGMERTNVALDPRRPGFVNVILANPHDGQAWQGLALQEILTLHNGREAGEAINKALGALIVAELSGNTASPLKARFEQMCRTLPDWVQQTYAILQARAQVDSARHQAQAIPPETAALADRGLPLPLNAFRDVSYLQNKNYGQANVDYGKYGILPESTSAIGLPAMRDHIGQATVQLSIDTNAAGVPVLIYVEQGSGYWQVDSVARSAAHSWRFTPTGKPERRIVPVEFVDNRMGWEGYYAGVEQLAQALALRMARNNPPAGDDPTRQLMTFRSGNIPEKGGRLVVSRPRDYLRSSPAQRTEGTNAQRWKSSVQELRQRNQTTPRDTDLLNHLATLEFMYYNVMHRLDAPRETDPAIRYEMLLSSRKHFLELIALEPNGFRGWYGWALTWVDEDAEVMAGGTVIARQLAAKVDKRATRLIQVFERMMMMRLPDNGRKRFSTIMARMEQRYQMTPPESENNASDYLANREKLAAQIVPAAQPLPARAAGRSTAGREKMAVVEGESGVVDFARAGVTPATRFSPKKIQTAGSTPAAGEVYLQIDVDRTGTPLLVMVTQSSGSEALDQGAVETAYLWRFSPGGAGKQVDVVVGYP